MKASTIFHIIEPDKKDLYQISFALTYMKVKLPLGIPLFEIDNSRELKYELLDECSFHVSIDVEPGFLFGIQLLINDEIVLNGIAIYSETNTIERIEVRTGINFYFNFMEFIQVEFENDKIVSCDGIRKSYLYGLVEKLDLAVDGEEFERAVKLRDEINSFLNQK